MKNMRTKTLIVMIIMALCTLVCKGVNWTNYPAATYPSIVTNDWTLLWGSTRNATNVQMTMPVLLQITKTNAQFGMEPQSANLDAWSALATSAKQNHSTGLDYWDGVTVDGTTITLSGGHIHSVSGGAGTVTSVAASVPTGLSLSGSPITTSGTLALTWSGTIPDSSLSTAIARTNQLSTVDAASSTNSFAAFDSNGQFYGTHSGVGLTNVSDMGGGTNSFASKKEATLIAIANAGGGGGGGGSSSSILMFGVSGFTINGADIRWLLPNGIQSGNLGATAPFPTDVNARVITNALISFTAGNGSPLGAGTNAYFSVWTNDIFAGYLATMQGNGSDMLMTNSGTTSIALPANGRWAIGISNGSASQQISSFTPNFTIHIQ